MSEVSRKRVGIILYVREKLITWQRYVEDFELPENFNQIVFLCINAEYFQFLTEC